MIKKSIALYRMANDDLSTFTEVIKETVNVSAYYCVSIKLTALMQKYMYLYAVENIVSNFHGLLICLELYCYLNY